MEPANMNKKDVQSDKLSLFSQINSTGLGLAGLLTAFVFFFGHIAGYFYYTSWEVDYLFSADLTTPYTFTMSSFGIFISTIACFLLFILFMHSISFAFKDFAPSEGYSFYHKIYNKILTPLSFLRFLFIVSALIYFIGLLFSYISSDSLRSDVQKKLYYPVNVVLSTGQKFQCLFSLGQLGSSKVFISPQMQPIYFNSSEITFMYHPMSKPPKELIQGGKLKVKNSIFEDEYKLWLHHWEKSCSSTSADNSYISLDFVDSTRDIDRKNRKNE